MIRPASCQRCWLLQAEIVRHMTRHNITICLSALEGLLLRLLLCLKTQI